MGLADFKDVDRNELSMIEVAHAILEDRGERMAFADIVNEMQKYLNKSDEEIRQRLPPILHGHKHRWPLHFHG